VTLSLLFREVVMQRLGLQHEELQGQQVMKQVLMALPLLRHLRDEFFRRFQFHEQMQG
jgi:hypothetical protein